MTQEEFAQQVVAMRQTLYRVSCSLLGDEADREDAVQSAIEKAWRGRLLLRNEAHLKTWLTRILINECYSVLRQNRRMQPVAEVPETHLVLQSAPGRTQEEAEETLLLEKLFSALPEEVRLMMVLYYVENYSVQEIARMTKTAEGTVKSRLHRGRDQLREKSEVKELRKG